MSTQAQSRNQPKSAPQQPSISERLADNDIVNQAIDQVRQSIRANPEAAALWCLGIGFVLGWKLKPW